MRRNRVQKRKHKRTTRIIERLLLTLCIIALLAICSSAILTKATTSEEADDVYYKYYTKIEIQEGDSLWSIAGKYMKNGPYDSRKEYMEEVVELNQLSSTTLYTGSDLIVPYFDDTYK